MNRETELHFAELPEIHRPRSKFIMPFGLKTTFNEGDLVPIYLSEIVPGDSCKMKMASVIRMSTPLFPTMDQASVDITFFFVPTRLVWTHWAAFWGENTNAWYQSYEYEVPQIKTKSGSTFAENSLADYFGLPLGVEGLSVSALPFRCYCKIWNDWWRDENLQQEAPNVDTDADAYTSSYAYQGGDLLKANKVHDYFTSGLPAPQKGNQALIPLGINAPVYARSYEVPIDYAEGVPINVATMRYMKSDGSTIGINNSYATLHKDSNNAKRYNAGVWGPLPEGYSSETNITPVNLWTDLSGATAASINDLRLAFQLQRFYEAQARGGSRYIEFIKNIFNVTSPDARLQRSEYLGGKRIPLNIFQAVQNSATTDSSPLGQTGAFSHTADSDEFFSKSFTEHGYIIGLACVRINSRTYGQGINRMWSRKKFYDYYIPQFANLGEQEIKNKELYAQGSAVVDAHGNIVDEQVFAYQERYAEYRYMPNMVTSSMRTDVTDTLSAWHYADHYTQLPTLGSTWIQENKDNIDRTLAVTSATANQFIADFYFKPTYVRPMPMYGVPGLIDHF